MIRISIFTLLALFWVSALQAQTPSITATVDKNVIAAGESLQLTITVRNARVRIQNPDIGGLVAVQGPFENSGFSFSNGQQESHISKTYVLRAGAEGTYTIGEASIQVSGKVLKTKPIKIQVVAADKAAAAAAKQAKQNRDLFTSISLNKRSAYVGEQVTATYYLYSRFESVRLVDLKYPQLNGFWNEDVQTGNTGWEKSNQTINGITYKVAVLKKQVLFPQKAGELTIEPLKMECTVSSGGFFSRSANKTVNSNRAKITVKPLPTPAPQDFNGAVGDLNMTVLLDRNEVPTNEAVNLKITFSGRCNLKLLPTPELDMPPDFEVYDAEIKDRIRVSGSGMSGTRSINYLIIPRAPGEFDLDELSVSYYDIAAKSYKTLSSKDLKLEVSKGSEGNSGITQRSEKQDVEELDADIRYIRTGDVALQRKDDFLFGSLPYMAGMATPLMAFLLLFGLKRRKEQRDDDVAGTRNRKASRVAKKHLAKAEAALSAADANTFYEALHKALLGYLADKFNLSTAQLNSNMISERSAQHGVTAEKSEQLNALLTKLQMARYAPIDNTPNRTLLEQAAGIIEHYESTLR